MDTEILCNQYTVIKECPKCGSMPLFPYVETEVFGRTYWGRCTGISCKFECNCGSSSSDIAVLNWNCEVEDFLEGESE